jgi:flagellar biosynthesis protein FliQ
VTSDRAERATPVVVDLAILVGLLLLAAWLRLPDLATRGTWDADQGHDMLVLRALVRDGTIPLLGPPTSIGDFHHGALYYYLLSPAAFLTGGDSPLAVVTEIALAGVAAVGVTWWLARSMAGSVAGLVAGLLMAVSATAVDESTFIWNPNLIALSSSVALAGAWRAWSTRRARWWLLAAVGTAVTMQCHVLGVTLLPIVGALLVADARRRGPGPERRSVLLAGLAGLAIIAVTYVPLVIHEATTDLAELRAAVAWLQAGAGPIDLPIPLRLLVVLTRVVTWPITGLITSAPLASLAGLALVLGVIAWRWRSPLADERVAMRWLGLGLLWSAAFLTFAASGLATVVPGLPNDHYHAFADPMVFTILGLGAAAAVRSWRSRTRAPDGGGDAAAVQAAMPAVVLGVALVALVGWNVANQPPAVATDGGFPAAEAAARRIQAEAGQPAVALRSLPSFKPADTYGYPLVRDGTAIVPEAGARTVVILCDDLFHAAIGAACGGPAEAASLASMPVGSAGGVLGVPFEAAPGRWVTVYAVR